MVPVLISLVLAAAVLESAPMSSSAPITTGPAASADSGPLTTSPLARPADAPKAVTSAPLAAPTEPAMSAAARLTPSSATPSTLDPKDDYSLVAWCHGALAGHMELYDAVREELNSVSPGANGDEEQMAAGREYLALYSRALMAAEAASPKNIHAEGLASDNAGKRIWAAAKAAEPRTRMWSWLMWELPPNCEIAAKRLEEKSKLFGQALKGADKSKALAIAEPSAQSTEGLRGLRGLQ
jgi:hypothetical protein